jgi:hypothetical protein
MGLKLRGAVRCGRCGKPRGVRHTCVARFGARTRRHRAQSPVTWECPSCHKARGLRHTCGNRGDFKTRKRKHAAAERQRKRKAASTKRAASRKAARERQAARRRTAAAERRARDRARKATAGKRAPRSRPRGDGHEPGTCGDRDCPRFGCKSYWAGMADCPGPHEGGA